MFNVSVMDKEKDIGLPCLFGHEWMLEGSNETAQSGDFIIR